MGRPARGVGLREAARGLRAAAGVRLPAGAPGAAGGSGTSVSSVSSDPVDGSVVDGSVSARSVSGPVRVAPAGRSASREFPTDWARTAAARLARATFLSGVMNPLLQVTLTADTFGAQVFDTVRDTPVIIVSNHSSHLDAPLLLCALPWRVRSRTAVTAAADYFFDSVWRGASSALAFSTVPIDRSGGVPSTTPLDLLRDGWNLVIFPEGTRSKDGARGRFRLGAGYLAINAGVPVVPVGVRGAFAAMPRGRNWPLAGRPQVTVRFGAPMRPVDGEDVRTFTARLAAEVDRLCAEDAGSWWDSTRMALAESPTAVSSPAGPSAAVSPADGSVTGAVDSPGGSVEPADLSGSAGAGGPGGAAGVEGLSPSAVPSGAASSDAAVGSGDASPAGEPVVPAARALDRARHRAAGRSGPGAPGSPVPVNARLRGAPGTPGAPWRRIWAATEPLPRNTSRSPWRR
ncbi:1-acyl-sn-glycerol-3-phosphate acyltransferase [Frankia sp. AiPs1]|uniref:lysophospholipid acyltransferase family protein n=1 Tax=Frankia sp. AiPa1 TaxID=573492 RepID=UPI00202ACCF3|nr:lysophospholipid acyltransferase family protein [Frankia sp. AiPa1]MCL9762082.1 1-acyl-sn-glycerol-3-phosphate acyltransferase [Frankia sp. AiPa1]